MSGNDILGFPAEDLVGQVVVASTPNQKEWRVGELLGSGACGHVFEVEPITAKKPPGSKYVIKMEMMGSSTLEDETKFYKKFAKAKMIEEWRKTRKLGSLGIPHFVASGERLFQGMKLRFLIIPRYERNLHQHIQSQGIEGTLANDKRLGANCVMGISLNIVHALEYVHEKGFTHNDIKADNVMVQLRGDGSSGKIDAFLCDFGLNTKMSHILDTDEGVPIRGTLLLMSIDAHNGKFSMRGELESLAFNMYLWLYGSLPWFNTLEFILKLEKENFLNNINRNNILTSTPGGQVVQKLLLYVQTLGINDKPDYSKVRKILKRINVQPVAEPIRRNRIKTRIVTRAQLRLRRQGSRVRRDRSSLGLSISMD